MDPLISALQKNILFSDLPPQDMERHIMPHARVLDFPKGAHLIRDQEICNSFGPVLQGKINILHIYASGDCSLSGVLEPGDLFGADLVCTKSRISPYYAEATQPTRILSLPAELLHGALLPEKLRLQLTAKLLRHIADENMRKEYRLAILLQKGLRDRILTYLSMQASKRHTATFSIPFTRDELASFLCVNRSCLSHELSRMAQEGILTFDRNTFTLLQWDATNGEY